MTYLQLINAVLRRLREDEVTDVEQSAYVKLIGDFINEAKREVEDATNWVQLRSTIQIVTEPEELRYNLTGAGHRYRILQVLNDTEDYELKLAPSRWMTNKLIGSGDPVFGKPQYYDVNGNYQGSPNVDLYPAPDAEYAINFNMVIPQPNLAVGDDVLIVPSEPVILGAHMKAISERGEDGGQSFGEVMGYYHSSLADAVAIDANKVPYEQYWEVV